MFISFLSVFEVLKDHFIEVISEELSLPSHPSTPPPHSPSLSNFTKMRRKASRVRVREREEKEGPKKGVFNVKVSHSFALMRSGGIFA